MKHLNQEETETVHLNLTAKDKWIEHYKELWYNANVPQEAAENIGGGYGFRFSNI